MKNGLAVFCSTKLGKWNCLDHTVALPKMGAIPSELAAGVACFCILPTAISAPSKMMGGLLVKSANQQN